MKKNITFLSFTILLLLYTPVILAQHTLYNDGAALYTGSSSLVHVEGEIENKTTSTLQNDGVIELMGNLANDSTAQLTNGADYSSTERAFKFIGPGTQSINGNMSDTTLRYIYNLIIDKSASGSAVILNTTTAVKGSLVFGSATIGAATYTPTANSKMTDNSAKGLIRTFDSLDRDYELYITNPSVDAVKGFASLFMNNPATDSFVQTRGAQAAGAGGLSRNVSVKGVPYIFPVGTSANGYNAAGFTFVALGSAMDKVRGLFVDAPSGVGSLGHFCSGCTSSYPGGAGFSYYFSSDPCNGSTPQWVILDQLPSHHGYWSFAGNDSDRYSIVTYPYYPSWVGTPQSWRTLQKSGSITAVPVADWTPDITTAISGPSDLLTYTLNTGCYTSQGIPGGQYRGFSNYQIARSLTGGALPVGLLSLTAVAIENKYIRLRFATASELDNAGFEVMRSTNGYDYTPIGWVAAAGSGNSSTILNYSYDDMAVQPGIVYYYKLDQRDRDGGSNETYIVQAKLSLLAGLNINCFPNPANTGTNIRVAAASDMKLTLELYNMSGQLMQTDELGAVAGENSFGINTSKLPSGLYEIVLRSPENIYTNTLNIIH